MIHVGNTEDGRRFEIPVHHTGIFGQTGVGKTRALKYMARQAVDEGFGVLIIDSKIPHPEFNGFGIDIPLYLEESTDADVFRSLIEGMRTEGRGDMNRYRGGFIEICEPPDEPKAESFKHIGARLNKKLHDKAIKGNTRVMYAEIRRDYNKLMEMLGEHEFSKKLEIPRPIARMETRVLPNVALQGLIVKSVIDQVLRQEKDLIILVDEAPNFCHQKIYNPAKRALMALDAQGRSKGIFGWYSGQTLTGFDKSNMKNLWYWVIGREMETNEAKDAHSVQTFKRLSVDEIRRLGVQEFVAVSPEATEKIRIPDVDLQGFVEGPKAGSRDEGKRVIHEETGLAATEKGDTVSWHTYNEIRSLLALEESKNNDLEKRSREVEAQLAQVKGTLEHTDKELGALRANYQAVLQEKNELAEQLARAQQEESAYKRLKMALQDVLELAGVRGQRMSVAVANSDGQVEVNAEDVEVVVVENTRMEKLDESSHEGRIAILLAGGFFNEPRTVNAVATEMSRLWGIGWGSNSRAALKAALAKMSQRPYLLLASDGSDKFTATDKGRNIRKEELVQ